MRWIPPFFYPSLFFSFLLSFLYSTEIILKTYSVPGILLHLILITQSPRSGIIFSWLFTLNSAILFFKTQFSYPPLQCAYQDSTKLSRCPSFVPAWNSLLPPITALSHTLSNSPSHCSNLTVKPARAETTSLSSVSPGPMEQAFSMILVMWNDPGVKWWDACWRSLQGTGGASLLHTGNLPVLSHLAPAIWDLILTWWMRKLRHREEKQLSWATVLVSSMEKRIKLVSNSKAWKLLSCNFYLKLYRRLMAKMELNIRLPDFWSQSHTRKGCTPGVPVGNIVWIPILPVVSGPENKGDHEIAKKTISLSPPPPPPPPPSAHHCQTPVDGSLVQDLWAFLVSLFLSIWEGSTLPSLS